MTPVAAAIDLGVTPFAIDETGVPRLLRGTAAMPRMLAADATSSARRHVERLAPAWGVNAAAVPALESLGEVSMPGGQIVQLRQVIDGIAVDRAGGGEVHVMVRDDGSLVAASGKLIASDTPHDTAVNYAVDDVGAVALAVSDLYQTSFEPSTLAMKSVGSDGTRMLGGEGSQINVSLSRAQKAWVPDGKTLIAAWIVEAYSSDMTTTDGDAFRTVVSADGRVLDRTNLKEDVAYTYRVFAENTGELHPFDSALADTSPHAFGTPNTVAYPPYIPSNLVTVDGLNHPGGSATPDPWLVNGRTETLGNNVEAYTDITAPDGLTFGDYRATITGTRTFDRSYDPLLSSTGSQAQQMTGITSLFYTINWLHDFWYDAGFTEAAGNAQNLNFGRGGQDRDAMNAEAQDNANGGSRNNANMSTPADGFPPRMQVFVWDGKEDRSLGISRRKPATGTAAFGAKNFEFKANVVLANDGNTTGGSTTSDACTALTAPATGLIVLADRGICTFKTKALNVQNAGGVAMILADNVVGGTNPPGMADDATITTPITIGVLSVIRSEGDSIKADLLAGPTVAQIKRSVGPDLEGTLDATVVSHEFMHYVHHRLSQCNTSLCGAMSEGWADFDALMVQVRAGDNFNGAYPTGTYSTASFAADPVYFGIRRAPYSSDLAINPLSFRHMGAGTPLPAGTPQHPFNGGGNNNEVHNSGEVWASMMWQGYSAMLQQPGAVFEATRRRMQQYVVGGLLLAPTDATPTETRDSILAAAHAANTADHDVLAASYALRGFGSCAVSPPRNSTTFVGIVESFVVQGRLAPGVPGLQSVARCDSDDVLDAGETGRITVAIANPGPAALADVNVTLTSTTPGITITRSTVLVGALAAYGTSNATFNIQLDAAVTTALAGDFTVTTTTTNGCNATVAVPLAIRLNTDDVPASSATDTFDAGMTVWTTSGSTGLWAHNRKTALDGFWFGADASSASDASVTSPPLTAGAGPVTVTFSHQFSFEVSGATAFDGGVIEYSTNDGTTWQDISAIANPGYNVTLTGTPATTGNPLAGRPAYGGTNPANPATNTVTLNLGTSLAGQTFRLRFRVGSDSTAGAPGWSVDNVAFTGITGTPFPTLVADPGHCAGFAPPGATGGDDGNGNGNDNGNDHADAGCQAGGSGVGAGAALGLLAVLLRRRRR